MERQVKPKKSLTAKLGHAGLFFLGFMFLYFLSAVLVQAFWGLHSTWFAGESSYTQGNRDIARLQEMVCRSPNMLKRLPHLLKRPFDLPENAAELRNELVEVHKHEPGFLEGARHRSQPPKMDEYILDLKEFRSVDEATLFSKKKIWVKACETETILYVYRPHEDRAYFFLCQKNTIDTSRKWECC